MATREEVLEKLKAAVAGGNIREAYSEFEELPIVDQLAISISPGVGDALAVYEVGEFAKRGSESLEEDSFLGALGNYGISALAAASLIPIFRLFRGARVLKAAPKAEPKLLENLEPTKVIEEATKDVPLPKVEEFKPLSLDEQMYPGTIFDNKQIEGAGQVLTNKGLTSKAAKFVNTNKKLPNQGKAIAFIQKMRESGVPDGELRLLNVIDETGEVHPKLMSELEIRNPQGKITRQRLANYIKSNQQGALSRRRLDDAKYSGEITDSNVGVSAIKENTYHVRGLDRKTQFDHYSNLENHKDHYVFDSIADLDLRAADGPYTNQIVEKVRDFVGGDSLLNVSRIQSDYAEEVSKSQQKKVVEKLNYLRDSEVFKDINLQMLPRQSVHGVSMSNYILQAVRQFPGLKTGKELKQKLFEELDNPKSQIVKRLILTKGENSAESTINTLKKYKSKFKPDDFEKLSIVNNEATLRFPTSPYVDAKQIATLKKGLNEYNQNVPKVNKLAQDKFKIQNELKASGLTPNSPSYLRATDELAEIDKQIADLVPDNSFGNFSEFTLNKTDLEKATGRPFTESLDKSVDEIFYTTKETTPVGGVRPIIQKYGPGTPLERASKYFDEMMDNSDQTFNIGNGLFILKKATKINPDLLKGYAIDPYAAGTRTITTKFPIRSNFLRAVTEGKSGMYLDSAKKRLGQEGGKKSDILQTTYKEAESEIAKIIRELGEDPKKYVKNFDDVGNAFDGTYVKIDDEIRKLVQDKGVDAFKDGGPAISKREQEKLARAKKEKIKQQFNDVVKKQFIEDYIEDTKFEDLYKSYKKTQDLGVGLKDTIGTSLVSNVNFPFKNNLKEIIKSDNPKNTAEELFGSYSTLKIDEALQNLNLPLDVRKTKEGTKFGKDIYSGDQFNIDFSGYKPDSEDFKGDIKFKYANKSPYGNVDIQSMLNELGDVNTFADYRYEDGPLEFRATKQPGRDLYGDVSYTLNDINLGNNQRLAAKAVVDNLKNAALKLNYNYQNPVSGGYLSGGLNLSNQRSPELNLEFGRRF